MDNSKSRLDDATQALQDAHTKVQEAQADYSARLAHIAELEQQLEALKLEVDASKTEQAPLSVVTATRTAFSKVAVAFPAAKPIFDELLPKLLETLDQMAKAAAKTEDQPPADDERNDKRRRVEDPLDSDDEMLTTKHPVAQGARQLRVASQVPVLPALGSTEGTQVQTAT